MKGASPRHGVETPLALFADLYELTMMQAYLREGMTGEAVFSLFVRRLPPSRNYLIACGLETVLDAMEKIHFTGSDLEYLSSLRMFDPDFLAWLKGFRFTGDVFAMPEGTPVFAGEPLLEVVAPLPEAQFFETLVMNQIHLQTVLASKAARVVVAAGGRKVVDFGARRMHGIDAANKAARAFYIAGIDATSNAEGGRRYGIPVTGTMGHSYIQAHESEERAFEAFSEQFPGTALLIDTYDTIAAARKVIALATCKEKPICVSAVRLDSGDLAALSREVRSMLDTAGLTSVQIIASGGLDEEQVAALAAAKAPIDAFGVGTNMGVSADAPALDIAYKLTEYDGIGRMKLSAGKLTLPGRKQIFRSSDAGKYSGDIIARSEERLPGVPVLDCIMRRGTRLPEKSPSLATIRTGTRDMLASLPKELLGLAKPSAPYRVDISPTLRAYEEKVREEVSRNVSGTRKE
jgi:nicotinate phosphoribosyltransferase